MKRKISRALWVALGFLSIGIGSIGIMPGIPIPTTPLYMLAVACFAKGSERFHRWFASTKLYKNHLESLVKTGGMTIKTKLSIVLPVSVWMIILIIWAPWEPMRLILPIALLAKYYFFIFRVKTIHVNPTSQNISNDSPE